MTPHFLLCSCLSSLSTFPSLEDFTCWSFSFKPSPASLLILGIWFSTAAITSPLTWWTATPTQWTWVWTSSGRWWRTGKPGVLQCMGLQRVGRNWTTNREKAMAPHSSTLARKIPWMEEPGGLQSMGSLRVGHDWATSLSLFTFMYWRRKWQPTPVFLPEESQGGGSLVGCCLWGRTESDTTEAT